MTSTRPEQFATAPQPASARPGRIAYADLLRVTAIAAVVAGHISGLLLARSERMSDAAWWTAVFYNACCHGCVPVFIMISGALLLAPSRTESTADFYRRRLVRVGIPLVFWTIFYLLWPWMYNGVLLPPKQMFQMVLMGRPFYHLYFLYLIAGLYVFTPMLRTVARYDSGPGLMLLALLMLVIASASQVISVLVRPGGGSALTMFIPFLGYYLAGHVIAAHFPARKWRRPALITALLIPPVMTILLIVGRRMNLENVALGLFFKHLSPTVVIMSLAIFIATVGYYPQHRQMSSDVDTVVTWLVPTVLGIYLIHPMFISVVVSHRWLLKFRPLIGVPFWSITIYLASLLCTLVLLKIPYVRRLVG